MAKSRISTENPDQTEVPVVETPGMTPEPAPKSGKAEKRENKPEELPLFARELLGKYRSYPELYIDAQGGVYTPGTAAVIRKGAVLYKNPHYQS